ncbi:MAG: 50S ribosomal protein L4 [Salibacteraceae bacterium]
MELAVFNTSGKETKKVKLNKAVFGIEPNDHAIYLDVKQFLANQRQGTHKAKERGEITGSTRKIKRQKGTGTARAGSLKNPLFKGGGRVFGPRPRSYSFKLNKKQKQLARRSALSAKVKESGLVVVEDFTMAAAKTKEYVGILNNLKVADNRSLIVIGENNKNIVLSSRNLQNSHVVTVSELNTYEIVKAKNVVISESALTQIETQLS